MADIHLRIDDELHRRFKAACAKKGYSMSWMIRTLMVKAVNDARVGEGLLGNDTDATCQQRAEEG